MSHNLLDHLGKNYFTGLPMLSTLYIENNKITAVHTEAFSGLEGKLIQKILTYTYIYMIIKTKLGSRIFEIYYVFVTIFSTPDFAFLGWKSAPRVSFKSPQTNS